MLYYARCLLSTSTSVAPRGVVGGQHAEHANRPGPGVAKQTGPVRIPEHPSLSPGPKRAGSGGPGVKPAGKTPNSHKRQTCDANSTNKRCGPSPPPGCWRRRRRRRRPRAARGPAIWERATRNTYFSSFTQGKGPQGHRGTPRRTSRTSGTSRTLGRAQGCQGPQGRRETKDDKPGCGRGQLHS